MGTLISFELRPRVDCNYIFNMVSSDNLDSKIVRQVEYYFGDINMARDKFMKTTLAENDGVMPFEILLKFNRLKEICDDLEVIKSALKSSELVHVEEKGVRRNPDIPLVVNADDPFEAFTDRSVYVKGFSPDSTLDEIMQWLESHGGKTANIHMRRMAKERTFKGSIFAVFEKVEDAKKLLENTEAAVYKEKEMTRMMRSDYWEGKKDERNKFTAKRERQSANQAAMDADIASRMTIGALLELSGLPSAKRSTESKDEASEEKKPADEVDSETTAEPGTDANGKESEEVSEEKSNGAADKADAVEVDIKEEPTVLALKAWVGEKAGTQYPVAWIDMEPEKNIAIVRFKMAGIATVAWRKIQESFGDAPVTYAGCQLSGRVLEDQEEKDHWKMIIGAQRNKASKRRHGNQGGGGGRGFASKRARRR